MTGKATSQTPSHFNSGYVGTISEASSRQIKKGPNCAAPFSVVVWSIVLEGQAQTEFRLSRREKLAANDAERRRAAQA